MKKQRTKKEIPVYLNFEEVPYYCTTYDIAGWLRCCYLTAYNILKTPGCPVRQRGKWGHITVVKHEFKQWYETVYCKQFGLAN